MKVIFKVGLVLVLFLTGFFGRGFWEGQVDRPEAMLRLFETHCLPVARGEGVTPGPELVALRGPAATYWADPRAVMAVAIGKSHCRVSDHLRVMTPAEQDRVRPMVEMLVEAHFPELAEDPRARVEDWDEFVYWAQFPALHPSRWGVGLYRVNEAGEDSNTDLWLNAPRSAGPDQADRSPAR